MLLQTLILIPLIKIKEKIINCQDRIICSKTAFFRDWTHENKNKVRTKADAQKNKRSKIEIKNKTNPR